MKDFFTYAEIGERFDDYALAWDKIQPVKFQKVNDFNIQALENSSAARLAQNKNYQLLLESAQWKEALDKEETITLNQAKFDELMKKRKDQIKKFEALDKFNNGLKFALYKEEVAREAKDEVFKKKSENWMKNLQKDLYLQEAVNVISEMK